ncbi:DUF2868 domain-containing protein [Endozoicomonas sp. G2_2]|uniref:DUF2868 domain-containing protein n=1 Tax=Endozoicomonas sp. G2_2 TaxID=2821092 RepID=UPI001ADC65F6|nr:DUF2868 domain-containing protein [Endozoicomonas sp. G2_2]MBO9469338.1 DUF2868 domain-containing protein [Endozoicomonas sp. G2_2]
MNSARRAGQRWTLADLIDFETMLARVDDDTLAGDRLVFARDIRPGLARGDESSRRRAGLRAWLAHRRAHAGLDTGRVWTQGLALLRLGLFAAMALAGMALVAGLCAGPSQSVHVVVFFALTLLLPWGVFLFWLGLRAIGGARTKTLLPVVNAVERLGRRLRGAGSGHSPDGVTRSDGWQNRLADSRQPRRALQAALGATLQWGALGFNLGLLLAFVGSLLIFDVRFYWEATPQTGSLVQSSVALIATPWRTVWPAAVPDASQIEASRARYIDGERRVATTPASTAAWWRFLLMSLLVWGVLPRLLLMGGYALAERRALARLDFQAPRHRDLWRRLAHVERGAVAAPVTDSALILDVGGSGVHAGDIRGFLLRALRVNPAAEARIGVLDDSAEQAADAALAASPAHVVLLVEDWGLSPRQAGALQARVRAAAGNVTPITWLVFARDDGLPTAPDAAHLRRWTRFIDGLRDPATEIVGYAPDI